MREEFIRTIGERLPYSQLNKIADWWIREITKKAESLKKNLPENEAYASGQGMYNQALEDLLSLLAHKE